MPFIKVDLKRKKKGGGGAALFSGFLEFQSARKQKNAVIIM